MAGTYWVNGADGKVYGPATLDTLARWITEGRIVAVTLVHTETSGWVEARALPELAAFFAAGGAAGGAGVPGAAGAAPAGVMPAAGAAGEFRAWAFLGQAWDLVKVHWLPLAGMIFIMVAIGCVPYLGACVQFLVGGAIAIGIWRAILGMIDGRPPEVGMMFSGFDQFGDAFLAYLVRAILVGLGYLLLIVPGIILSLMWAFTFPVLAENRIGFWEAMRRSAVVTEGYRWRLFLLALACFPVLLLGLIALCVGIFVAFPVCLTAFGLAYRWLLARKGMLPGATGGVTGVPVAGGPMYGAPGAGGPGAGAPPVGTPAPTGITPGA